jgi:hypothetical protein
VTVLPRDLADLTRVRPLTASDALDDLVGRSTLLDDGYADALAGSREAPELAPRQREVLAAIESATAERGYPPTLRELGAALGISSTNGVYDHLRALRRKGAITWDPTKARTLRVTAAGRAR